MRIIAIGMLIIVEPHWLVCFCFWWKSKFKAGRR